MFRKLFFVCFLFYSFLTPKNIEADSSSSDLIRKKSLNVLILGGTTFLGPHLTWEFLKEGHTVTHFNRGNSQFSSFNGVETIYGDRTKKLEELEGRKWDVVIDTCGYLPKVVEASSKILAKNAKHYVFISTISVYENFHESNIDENFPLAKLRGLSDEIVTDASYGPLKAHCEEVVKKYFPNNSLIVRPGIIVGPYDPSDRLTYWVRKVYEGEEVLVPNSPKQKLQFIDVRDLSRWIVKMVENCLTGIYNATGPASDLTFEEFVHECQKFSKNNTQLIWVDEDFLLTHLDNTWINLPLWLSKKVNEPGLFSINNRKARKAGLTFRPLSETIEAILEWDKSRSDKKMKVGLSSQAEENLLKIYKMAP